MSLVTHNVSVEAAKLPRLIAISRANNEFTSQVNEGLKRSVDLALASIMLVILLPLMLIIALAVRITSGEPIFYKQERVGKNGIIFNILKFRTMINDAEAESGPVWSDQNDSRVTAIGHILRKTHLDELPQLINVIKGDMALIGPRPERPYFVEQFRQQGIKYYNQRHQVRGGITGYAQILCATPTIDQINDKTKADLYYIENWTVALEMKIILKTIQHILDEIWQAIK